jgi:indolepyruvate ferredoxin oxidoreductase beta subunit
VAELLGQPRVANTVVLGCLAARLTFPRDLWQEVVADLVPPGTVEINLQAFERGWALEEEQR